MMTSHEKQRGLSHLRGYQCKMAYSKQDTQEKILDILGYLKNTHKNPKFGRVRQIPIREFPTKFPNWDLSHSPSSQIGIFVGIL